MTTLNKKQIPDLPVSKITGLDIALSNKVTTTNEVSKLYGTDESGNQVTYNLDEVGGSDGETIRNQNTDLGVTRLLYNWEGTFQQYIEQDVEHLHPEWICLITDDIINGSIYTPDLLDTKWSDHLLDNPSWVLSDGNWKSQTLYPKIYEHLRFDYLEVSSDPQTETINEITITYYLTNDGHKIVLSDQLTNVDTIYADTGVAWYYVLDTENERFKLPRTKFAFTGIRTAVGNYVEAGLPNITGSIERVLGDRGGVSFSGAFADSTNDGGNGNNRSWNDGGIYLQRTTVKIDASDSSSIYGNSDTVQPSATEMYLYFYAGTYHATNNINEIDILEAIYPVGSLYFGTQNVCPMEAIMSGSTWELVSAGKALWTGDGTNANTTIEAGLPNVKGTLIMDTNNAGSHAGMLWETNDYDKGPFKTTSTPGFSNVAMYQSSGAGSGRLLEFDMSKANSTYSDSVSTVQPPAYVVNVWRRTA